MYVSMSRHAHFAQASLMVITGRPIFCGLLPLSDLLPTPHVSAYIPPSLLNRFVAKESRPLYYTAVNEANFAAQGSTFGMTSNILQVSDDDIIGGGGAAIAPASRPSNNPSCGCTALRLIPIFH